jgi:DNA repair protein RecO (recombination protein O)
VVVRASAQFDQAFVLHRYPYSETSLLIHLWTIHHGRVVVVGKGARRPGSPLRSVLAPFQPLAVSFAGKGEVKTLRTAETTQIVPQLMGAPLFAAFYANELILKLTSREDAHPAVFSLYADLIEALAITSRSDLSALDRLTRLQAIEPTLRAFEFALVRELGYGLSFTETCTQGDAVIRGKQYWLVADRGVFPYDPSGGGARDDSDQIELSGEALLDIANEDYTHAQTASEIKRAARLLIGRQLGATSLHTKSLFVEHPKQRKEVNSDR